MAFPTSRISPFQLLRKRLLISKLLPSQATCSLRPAFLLPDILPRTTSFTTTPFPKSQDQQPQYTLPPRPRRDLHGKVAIITGAGAPSSDLGNGRATALLLASDGASVVCVDKNLSLAQHTVSMISSQTLSSNPSVPPPPPPAAALAIEADVTREEDCIRIVGDTINRFGRVDILVNVVGIMGPSGTAVSLEDVEGWDWGMRVNVTSMMLMVRHVVPAMVRNGGDGDKIKGSIVNIGSVAGLRGGSPSLLYPASKGAVVNMTRAMAAHHGKEGVRVNCVCPGMLYTPMMYAAGMTDEMREARRKRSLLQTEGNAWDCASAVRFLAGDEARWITGAVLTVDAGATAAVSLSS
ncbi:putative short-chain dehydrogenase reductase sdr protein [Echria macrotheca]|uniref:Short-chain dehydrogenase reductase sdr protein n=1 Tax=Echria macrotheca TaxID=438768 RepID=A0AAJ0FE11_9PEZI|nr:putative short-chain dehydrogenase reductase sdr protein [Echria macrotheca]